MFETSVFVLNRAERGEADYLLNCYTRELGFLRVRVPGVRKERAKLRGHIEPHTKTELSLVEGRGGLIATSAELAESYPAIGASLEKQIVAARISEIVARVFFREEDIAVWGLLESFFAALDSADNSLKHLQAIEWWAAVRLLAHLGYRPSSDTLFLATPRLRKLFHFYETTPAAHATDIDVPSAGIPAVASAIMQSFQYHCRERFEFLLFVQHTPLQAAGSTNEFYSVSRAGYNVEHE